MNTDGKTINTQLNKDASNYNWQHQIALKGRHARCAIANTK